MEVVDGILPYFIDDYGGRARRVVWKGVVGSSLGTLSGETVL